jgi:hypothetical protein
MWHLLPWRRQVYVVAVLAVALAWAVDASADWLYGQHVPLIKFASLIVFVITSIVAGVVSLTWRRIWQKFPFIARKTFPDLNGTWEGTLVSTWIDPETYKRPPPIPATVWIRQNLFSVSVRLRTGESTSYSTRCLLEADHDAGRFRIWYSYDNRPKAEVAYRSARHEGVAWLETDIDADPNRLTGLYYSDRRTTGDMSFCRVSRELSTEVPSAPRPLTER